MQSFTYSFYNFNTKQPIINLYLPKKNHNLPIDWKYGTKTQDVVIGFLAALYSKKIVVVCFSRSLPFLFLHHYIIYILETLHYFYLSLFVIFYILAQLRFISILFFIHFFYSIISVESILCIINNNIAILLHTSFFYITLFSKLSLSLFLLASSIPINFFSMYLY
jgi:hypothetical protein